MGLGHVISGPDHLAAIAPLAAQGQRRAWVSGVRWGFGHASGVLVVGVLTLFLRELLPINAISSWSERLVGVMLIGIGFWGLRNALRLHAHEHKHEAQPHVHLHIHPTAKPHVSPQAHVHRHTAFGIGTLHGLAGSAHFMGILPTLAMSRVNAIIYLSCFGIGTVFAMGLFASGIGWMSRRLAFNGVQAYRGFMCVCSVAAVGIGVWWLFQSHA